MAAVDLVSLQEQYPDVQGWLTIPDTGIDYPVLQSEQENGEFYLKRNYKKEYDINGSLFLQADCKVSESRNLTIYGHNMNSGAMFGNLDLYAGEDYYNAHRFAYLQTEDGIQEYKIVTVLKADRNLFPFQQKLPDVAAVQEYLKVAKRREVFETGDDYLKCIYDKVLTLVTCSYEWSGARNIVLAVPVSGAFWGEKVFVSTRKVQKMRQIMTTRDRKCSKQGSIAGMCARCIQVENVFKRGNFGYTLRPICQCSDRKVSENPLKVRKMRQIMAVQDGKCSKQRDYVRLCIGSISAKSV